MAAEASEVALDIFLDDEILKEIPVFGLLVKGYRTIISITERLFLKKVALFLFGVGKASASAREKYKSRLDSDPDFRKKVGENLLLLIDRHERLDKSYILGQLMARVVEGKCAYDDFLRIAAALDKSTIEDLKYLASSYNNIRGIPESIRQSLYKSDFLDMQYEGYSEPDDDWVEVETSFKLNSIGNMLVEYVFSEGEDWHL